jgi:hypothetical protein
MGLRNSWGAGGNWRSEWKGDNLSRRRDHEGTRTDVRERLSASGLKLLQYADGGVTIYRLWIPSGDPCAKKIADDCQMTIRVIELFATVSEKDRQFQKSDRQYFMLCDALTVIVSGPLCAGIIDVAVNNIARLTYLG